MWNRWKNLIFLSQTHDNSKTFLSFLASPSELLSLEFRLFPFRSSETDETNVSEIENCVFYFPSWKNIGKNMLVKQYAFLLTFVYLFKWNRRAGEKYGERMEDNSLRLFSRNVSNIFRLPVIECSFFEITQLNCICSISEMNTAWLLFSPLTIFAFWFAFPDFSFLFFDINNSNVLEARVWCWLGIFALNCLLYRFSLIKGFCIDFCRNYRPLRVMETLIERFSRHSWNPSRDFPYYILLQ